MSNETKEIERLRKWCDEARKIVGLGVKGKSKKMEQQINNVATMLKKLSEKEGKTDKQLFQASMEEFKRLAEDHRQRVTEHGQAETNLKSLKKTAETLAKAAKKTPKGSKEHLAAEAAARQVEEAEQALVESRQKIKALIPKMQELQLNLVNDAPLAKAMHFFELEIEKARKALKQEASRALSDESSIREVQQLIDNLEQEVSVDKRFDDPAVVTQKTEHVKTLLQRLITREKTSTTKKQTLDVAQSRAKPGAEYRLEAAKNLQRELEGLGMLVEPVRTQLANGITAAERLVLADDFVGANAGLLKLPTREQCNAAYLKAKGGAIGSFKVEIEMVEQGIQALGDLLHDSALAQLMSQRNQLIGEAAGKSSVKDVAQMRGRFKTFVDELAKRRLEADGEFNALKELFGVLSLKVRQLDPVVPLHVADENGRQLELVTSLRGERRHGEALSAGQILQEQLKAQANPDHSTWLSVESEMRGTTLTVKLDELKQQKGVPGALQGEAARLGSAMALSAIERAVQAREWSALVALHTEVKSFIANSAGAIQKYAAYATERDKAAQGMQRSFGDCTTALDQLENTLTRAGVNAAPVMGELRKRLALIQSEWNDKVSNATDGAQLDIPATLGQIDGLKSEVSLAGADDQVAATKKGQLDASGLAEFRNAVSAIERGDLAELAQLSGPKVEEFRTEIGRLELNSGLETDPATPWAKRLEALQGLATRVNQAKLDAASLSRNANAVLKLEVERVAGELLQAKRALAEKLGRHANRFEPLFTALGDELDNLRTLTDTTNISAAKANEQLLAGLKQRLTQLNTLITNSSSFEDTRLGLERHKQAIADLVSEGLKDEAEATSTSLKEQYGALEKDIYGMEPGAAGQALTAMALAIDKAKTELAEIKRLRIEVRDKADLQARRIQAFAQQGFADTYRKSLQDRVAAARKKAAAASELPAVSKELDVIASELDDIERDPQTALSHQKQLLNEEHANTKLKNEYQGKLILIEDKALPRARQAVKDADGDDALVTEVERIVGLAKKAVKDSGDYERALNYLTQAEIRVQQIERNPEGTGLGDRKALPKHAGSFANEVRTLRTALDNFVNGATSLVAGPQKDAVTKALTAAVGGLKSRLNPNQFDLLVSRLTDKDLPAAVRREAREQALQRVRETSTFVSKHPTMVKIALNPIAPLKGELRVLDTSLVRLEAHLRASVH